VKYNIAIGIGFVILAVVLAIISRKRFLGNGWLNQADKIASILSLIVALAAFIFHNPSKVDTFSVFLRDGTTRRPVVGAKVTLEFKGFPYVDYTNSDGRYTTSLPGKIGDLINILIEKDGYEVFDRTIKIESKPVQIQLKSIPQTSSSDKEIPIEKSKENFPGSIHKI
jgi:hypothetical protein